MVNVVNKQLLINVAISQTFANSNMKTEALTSVALGTTVDFGGAILKSLKQAREDKIKNKINTISNNENQFINEIDLFQTYLKNNQYDDLIESHKKLLKLELNSLIEAQWLKDKHSSDFEKYINTVTERQNNRIELIMNINSELFKTSAQNMNEIEIFNTYISLANKEIQMHLENDKEIPFHHLFFQEDYVRNLDHLIYSFRFKRNETSYKLYYDNKISKKTLLKLLLIEPMDHQTESANKIKHLFFSLNKENQLDVIFDLLNYSVPRAGFGYFLKYKTIDKVKGASYNFSNFELLLNNGKGLNYYYSFYNDKGELIPLYEHIKKITTSKNSRASGNRNLYKKIKEFIKADEISSGKDRETLFLERGDCTNPTCDKIYFEEDAFNKSSYNVMASLIEVNKIINSNPKKWKTKTTEILNKYQDKLDAKTVSNLYFNLGVVNTQLGDNIQAKKSYLKSIEFNNSNENTYINLALLILDDEERIINSMNSLGDSKEDDEKWKKLNEQRKLIYKSAIVYLEKALLINKDNTDIKTTLIDIYTALDNKKEIERLKKM